jgi:hypothetical protein
MQCNQTVAEMKLSDLSVEWPLRATSSVYRLTGIKQQQQQPRLEVWPCALVIVQSLVAAVGTPDVEAATMHQPVVGFMRANSYLEVGVSVQG